MQFCNYLINSFQFKRTLIFLFIFLIIKKPYSKKFWLRFLFEMMLQDLNHAVLQTLQKIIWKDIYVLQDDLVNKALPFAKLSPWVCWWIWIFLSFLRKFHVKDFIPIGTLCISYLEFVIRFILEANNNCQNIPGQKRYCFFLWTF